MINTSIHQNISRSNPIHASVMLRVILTGCSGCDGQSSVHSRGDLVEIILEVQPEQWRRITQPVSITNTLKHVHSCCYWRWITVSHSSPDPHLHPQTQRVWEATAQIMPGGAVQVWASVALDARVWQPALPDSGGDPHPWCTETYPQ